MDLTHMRPVPAPSIARLMTASGLKDVTVDFRSPVPAELSVSREALVAAGLDLSPVLDLLFAPQDFAVTGLR
jgi:hypothetical protein